MNGDNDTNKELHVPLIEKEDVTVTTADPTPSDVAELQQAPISQVMRVHPVVEAMEAGPTHVTGKWRDGCCDCCAAGPVVCLMACFFPWTLVAQVMRRFNLGCRGKPGTEEQSLKVFYCMCGFEFALKFVGVPILFVLSLVQITPQFIGFISFWALVYFLFITRTYIRQRYEIPTVYCSNVGECEDLFCAICCQCCIVGQMARHTSDYNKYPVALISTTGLHETPNETV